MLCYLTGWIRFQQDTSKCETGIEIGQQIYAFPLYILASAMDYNCIPFKWLRGLGHSTSEESKPPSGSSKSENEVVELYSPDGAEPEMEIIFFPGLLDLQLDSFEEPFTKTWVAGKNENLIWPKEWLSKVFPRARILFVSCASENKLFACVVGALNKLFACVEGALGEDTWNKLKEEDSPETIPIAFLQDRLRADDPTVKEILQKYLLDYIGGVLGENKRKELKHHPHLLAFVVDALVQTILGSPPGPLAFIGEALVQKIFGSSSIHNRPVFLVSHSLGGIVIKYFIQSCKKMRQDSKKIDEFLENLTGVFYYATPNEGSKLKHFAKQTGMRALRRALRKYPHDGDYRTSQDYRKFSCNGYLRTFAVLEGLPTHYKRHKSIVVGESSARSDVDDFYIHTTGDHLTVCKARDENDPVVIGKLTTFILSGMPKAKFVPPKKKEWRPVMSVPYSEDERVVDGPTIHVLNDSVCEFCCPSDPEMDIIFFHGLQQSDYKDAVWGTWLAKDSKDIIWPKEWLSKVFPKARILSISYNSSATKATGQMGMEELGRNLVSNIIEDANHKIGRHGPVFLVGHSLGGIVIKQFILAAIAKQNSFYDDTTYSGIDTFLHNLTGVFYYATPHGGSRIANFVTDTVVLKRFTTRFVKFLRGYYGQRQTINEEFRQQRSRWDIRTFAMAEGLPIKILGVKNLLVVEEASAREGVDLFYTHTTANHYTVCKAKDMSDPVVIGKLTQFITNAMEKATVTRPSHIPCPPDFGNLKLHIPYLRVSSWPEPRPSRKDDDLNDSVWEVYSPKQPELDVIFFHGVQPDGFKDASWTTWVPRDHDTLLWPKSWLPRWLPKARILLISYDLSASQNDMYALGENLVGNVIFDANCSAGQNCPVFLVSHSVGGIVMKQFILSAIRKKNLLHPVQYKREIDRIKTFLKNFKGVSYYATPNGDSDGLEYANRLVHASPVLGRLVKLNVEKERINEEFRQVQRRILKIRALALTETEKFQYTWGRSAMIVEEKSAQQDSDEFEKCQGSNHFDICKARGLDDRQVIGRLVKFITGTMPKDKLITVIRRPRESFSTRYHVSVSSYCQADLWKPEEDVLEMNGLLRSKKNKYIVQLNDSVWELHSPSDTQPEMDIIFFSGPDESGETFWKTWVAVDGVAVDGAVDDKDLVWPKEWLSKWFPKARILLIIPDTVEVLVANIILHGNCNAGQNCPVFLVGPSVGGNVCEDFLYATEKKSSLHPDLDGRVRIQTFLGNVKGEQSYDATPHLGADVQDKLERGSEGEIPKASGMLDPEELARQDIDSSHTHDQVSHLTADRARSINDYEVIGRLAESIVNRVPAGSITCSPPHGFVQKVLDGRIRFSWAPPRAPPRKPTSGPLAKKGKTPTGKRFASALGSFGLYSMFGQPQVAGPVVHVSQKQKTSITRKLFASALGSLGLYSMFGQPQLPVSQMVGVGILTNVFIDPTNKVES